MSDPLTRLVNENVVLDTAGPIVYLGQLVEVTPDALVLVEADLHDCRDGHGSKEVYAALAVRDGITANRHRVVVMRHVVISVSALADVVSSGGGDSFYTDDGATMRANLNEQGG